MQILLKESKRFLKEYKIESILIIVTVFILTTSTAYNDFYATTRHGMEFWTVLFEGRPLQFYEHCSNIKYGNSIYYGNAGCAYDFSVYAVFAIWNFPIWLIEKIWSINAQDNLLCVVWGKMLMVCAVLVSVRLLCEIYSLITENGMGGKQKDFLILNYLASLLLLSYTISSGNYDILSVVTILYGIVNYLKGNYKKFLIWFMIAATFKYFAIFVFIPLLLLKEKRILFIIRDMMILISLSVVEKIIFTRHHISRLSESAGGGFLEVVPNVTVAGKTTMGGTETISLLFVLYAALIIYCYMQDDNKNMLIFRKKSIYICLCSWAIFFMFVSINSYWIVLIVPFLILTLQTGNANKKINYLMEAIFSVAMFLTLNMRQYWILGGNTCMRMLPHRILCFFFPEVMKVGGYHLGNFLSYINDKFNIQIYLNSTCLITLIVFLIINFPGKNGNESDISEERETTFMRNRLLVNIGLSLVPVTLYVLQIFYWLHIH